MNTTNQSDERQSGRNLLILWIGTFTAAISFSLVVPFLPRFIGSLGVVENLYLWSGSIYSVSFLTSAIMAPVWGNLADRHGRRPMVIRSGIAIAVVNIAMSFVTSPGQLFALRTLNGLLAGFIPASVALVATNTPEHRLGRSLVILQTGPAAGTILGPMLGGLLADLFGIRVSMQIAGCLILLSTALVWLLVKERKGAGTGVRTSPLHDLKLAISHPRLLAVLIATMLVSASYQTLEPILTIFVPTLRFEPFLEDLTHLLFGHGDARNSIAGLVVSLPAVAMLTGAARWARLGERIGFPKLMLIGLAMAGLFALPQSLVQTAGQLILLRFAYGIALAAGRPALDATLAQVVHPSFRGRAYGINSAAFQLGGVVGPLLSGNLADWVGPRYAFVLAGSMLLSTAAWVGTSLANRDPNEPRAGAPL